jgi:hypothetical protein
MRHDGSEPGREPERTITSKDSDPEAGAAHLTGDFRAWDQPLVVDFLGAAVKFTKSPETGDATSQEPSSSILDAGHEYGPVRTLHEDSPWATPRHAAGPGDVEDEESTRPDGSIEPLEQPGKRRLCVATIEEVIQAFTHSRDGNAGWEISLQEGSDAKLPGWDARSRQGDHRVRDVDAQNIESGIRDSLGQNATATAQVDHQAPLDPTPSQGLNQELRGILSAGAEASVVDVSQIVLVSVGHPVKLRRIFGFVRSVAVRPDHQGVS